MIFDNQIVDDARGRATTVIGLRPRFCSRSRSGDGACLKRRRCWFDSRREHRGEARLRQFVRVADRLEMVNNLERCSPRPGSRSGIRLVSKTGQRGSIPRPPAPLPNPLPASERGDQMKPCREGWALAGLISLGLGRFDSDPCNSRRDLAPPLSPLPAVRAEGQGRGAADEARAGRPRVARLQAGGSLVGEPPCPALQA